MPKDRNKNKKVVCYKAEKPPPCGKGDEIVLQLLPWIVAGISTAAFVFLWFREARRVLALRKNMIDSAARQLSESRRRAQQEGGGPACAAVLARSRSIYRQAVENYNGALHSIWLGLPGRILGYRELEYKI